LCITHFTGTDIRKYALKMDSVNKFEFFNKYELKELLYVGLNQQTQVIKTYPVTYYSGIDKSITPLDSLKVYPTSLEITDFPIVDQLFNTEYIE